MTMTRHINRWMLLLLTVLLTSCGSKEEEVVIEEDCYLDIYVYAPDRPIVTRAEVGDIEAADAEKEVKSLKIWVFRYSDAAGAKAVGYLNPDATFLNMNGQQKFQLMLNREFANNPGPVDVYVVANDASCGLTTLNENTTRAELDAAVIGTDYFGASSPLTSVVPSTGLPMSAMLKNQPVSGKFPTLRVGTEEQMATLQLTRAVSKVRFVICRIKEETNSTKTLKSIDNISLDADQIPTESWLIARTSPGYSYVTDAISYGGVAEADVATKIPQVEDPLKYVYETQSAQDYENLIDEAIGNRKLYELARTYYRESDKQLKGTIQYTYTDGNTDTQTTAEFSMAAPGDFLRNHSWIVYIYFMDSKIHVLTVTHIGMKKWISDGVNETVTFYNW